jgi:hypothetical protein
MGGQTGKEREIRHEMSINMGMKRNETWNMKHR